MKKRLSIGCVLLAIFSMLIFYSCKKDPRVSKGISGFPSEIEEIFETKCAVSGCHNDKSFQNAAQLNLTTWDNLVYEGGVSGSVVIAYKPEFSSLFQFCNTYEDLGLTALPSMPLNADPLTRDEVVALKKWITEGCKNDQGEVPFASDYTSRKKVFFTNQGCDVTTVIDAETKLAMRYFNVGNKPGIEVPHNMTMSSDGQFIYMCFIDNNIVQKYSVADNSLVGEVELGVLGSWNVIKLNADNSKAFVSDLNDPGKLAVVNTSSMTMETVYQGPGLFSNPHGVAVKGQGDTIYITAQNGNFFYRFIPAIFSNVKFTVVPGQAISTAPGTYDPHEIIFSPDQSMYFLSCQASNEVRVFKASNDSLIKVINTGIEPLEFAFSENKNYLFVSCSETPNPNFIGLKGSVEVIDLSTLTIVKTLYSKFFQPHGMIVDESRNELWVGSRNSDVSGPAPHHVSECGGRNGYFEVIDIDTWQTVRGASELSVDPYSAVITP